MGYDSPFDESLSSNNTQICDALSFSSCIRKLSKSSDCHGSNVGSTMARPARRSDESKGTYGKQMHQRLFWCLVGHLFSRSLSFIYHYFLLPFCQLWIIIAARTRHQIGGLKIVAPCCTLCNLSTWIMNEKLYVNQKNIKCNVLQGCIMVLIKCYFFHIRILKVRFDYANFFFFHNCARGLPFGSLWKRCSYCFVVWSFICHFSYIF